MTVCSNVEGITEGCDIAKLPWNEVTHGILVAFKNKFLEVAEFHLVEMVFRRPEVSYLEIPDPGTCDLDLENAFGESSWILVNDAFVNQIPRTVGPEKAGTFLVVFEQGFKWRTYLADSEVILETSELPWTILDTGV
jgi:hypothetical protein